MIIIEQLKEEHQAILLMLKIVEAACTKLETGENVSKDDLNDMVKFIKEFADKSHHLKEEDLLFPAMEEVGIPREGGPIGVMLTEHTMGRDFVKGLSNGIEKYTKGNSEAANQIIENARNYASLLSNHINKEDNILYPMAEMRLSKEKHDELLKEFEKVNNEKIGLDKQNELIAILHKLKDKYLQ
ncbi:MAG: hemerythrin [Ignavibacteriae bacterium]|nr:MAG: hemerythrin [Ignavibacteriota bacterium]